MINLFAVSSLTHCNVWTKYTKLIGKDTTGTYKIARLNHHQLYYSANCKLIAGSEEIASSKLGINTLLSS